MAGLSPLCGRPLASDADRSELVLGIAAAPRSVNVVSPGQADSDEGWALCVRRGQYYGPRITSAFHVSADRPQTPFTPSMVAMTCRYYRTSSTATALPIIMHWISDVPSKIVK